MKKETPVLARLARTCFRHHRLVLVAWLVVLVAAVTGGAALAGHYATGDDAPKTLLTKEFPARNGDDATIVFTDVTADRGGVDRYLDDVSHLHGVSAVEPLQIAPDGHIAIAPITLANGVNDKPSEVADAIEQRAGPLDANHVGVEFAGQWFAHDGLPSSELIGILAAVVILLIAFGSVVAMGLPIVTALFGVAIAAVGVGIVANVLHHARRSPRRSPR